MSAPFALKEYQIQTLQALQDYFKTAERMGSPNTAFYHKTNIPYLPAPQLEAIPYVCMRVPTGGGKTLLAAHSVGIAATDWMKTDQPTVIWFVPSQTIRDQTLASLRNRNNPNRRALSERFGENVRIMDVNEALYAKRADYDGGAVIIVATIQAFRVDNREGRKVYESNGELMDHFAEIPPELRALLERDDSSEIVFSLANVFRLRRPLIIADEAHNMSTSLSFDTLARLSPSAIVEFTATPTTPEEHNPNRGKYASNILHRVSAAELKAADMIKLPVVLRGRVSVDLNNNVISVRGSMTDYERKHLEIAWPEGGEVLTRLVHKSRGVRLGPLDDEKEAIAFSLPGLAVRFGNQTLPFDKSVYLASRDL